ncbi:MAG: YidC/Oxa1 family membrane protein insertase [Lachnospiraceae bacterium]|nr:YidC/Oxa1 family membrane protein insertase [Lachnospiraceae bacterium]
MYFTLLTPNSTPIFKYIVWILGKIMEGIFYVLNQVGIPNIGLSIIFFTIIVNVCMIPLTYKQQKFSKLSMKMNPEIKAIQKKYDGKKDQDSMMKMNAETQAVYAKYGTSPTGSCAYLLIQMPILFALYRVIYQIPAYVTRIGNTFRVLAERIVSADNGAFITENTGELESVSSAIAMYSKNLAKEGNLENGIIDVLNRVSSADMTTISEHYGLSDVTFQGSRILSTLDANGNIIEKGLIDTYNNFLGLNIRNTPWYIMKESFANHAYLIMILAVLIPLVSGFTQWLSIKLAPNQAQPTGDNSQADAMAQQMKTMNTMMPLVSIWFCFTLPAGMGLYWIANAVVRVVLQIFMNKKIDKIDFDALIEQNKEKSAKKLEKAQALQAQMQNYANVNTRSIQTKASYVNKDASTDSKEELSKPSDYAPGSMAAKANMVAEFNRRNTK